MTSKKPLKPLTFYGLYDPPSQEYCTGQRYGNLRWGRRGPKLWRNRANLEYTLQPRCTELRSTAVIFKLKLDVGSINPGTCESVSLYLTQNGYRLDEDGTVRLA